MGIRWSSFQVFCVVFALVVVGVLGYYMSRVPSHAGEYSFTLSPESLVIERGGALVRVIALADIPPQSTNVGKDVQPLDDPVADYIFASTSERESVLFDRERERVYFLVFNKHNIAPRDMKAMMFAYDVSGGEISIVIPPSEHIFVSEKSVSSDFVHVALSGYGSSEEAVGSFDSHCIGTSGPVIDFFDLLSGTKVASVDVDPFETRVDSRARMVKMKGWKSAGEFTYEVFTALPTSGYQQFFSSETRCNLEEVRTITVTSTSSDVYFREESSLEPPSSISFSISEDQSVLTIYDGLYGKGDAVGRVLASSLPGYEHKGGTAPAKFTYGVFHPSGENILFVVSYLEAQNTYYAFGMARFDGSGVRMLKDAEGSNIQNVSFSPSGDYFAYMSSRSGGGCQYERLLYVYHVFTQTKKVLSLPTIRDKEIELSEGFGVTPRISYYYWDKDDEIVFRNSPVYCGSDYQEMVLEPSDYRWKLSRDTLESVADSWSTYESAKYGFRFMYPSNFVMATGDDFFPIPELLGIHVKAPYRSFENINFIVRAKTALSQDDLCEISDVVIGKAFLKARKKSCGDAGYSASFYVVPLQGDLELWVSVGSQETAEPVFAIPADVVRGILDSIEVYAY